MKTVTLRLTPCLDCGEPWCRRHREHYADCPCPGLDPCCPVCGEFGIEESEGGPWCSYCGKVVEPVVGRWT